LLIGLKDNAIITVSSNTSKSRQRFSIGHELGHWLKDHGKLLFFCKKENINLRSKNIPIAEKKANDFAADLLLPKNIFLPISRNRDITIDTAKEISENFCTSVSATAYRLVQLGSFPSMIVSFNQQGNRWFNRGPDLPEHFLAT
jgi:Zn-dependent peptidase ImmA (M78 family)